MVTDPLTTRDYSLNKSHPQPKKIRLSSFAPSSVDDDSSDDDFLPDIGSYGRANKSLDQKLDESIMRPIMDAKPKSKFHFVRDISNIDSGKGSSGKKLATPTVTTKTDSRPRSSSHHASKDTKSDSRSRSSSHHASKDAKSDSRPRSSSHHASKDAKSDSRPRSSSHHASKDAKSDSRSKSSSHYASKDAKSDSRPRSSASHTERKDAKVSKPAKAKAAPIQAEKPSKLVNWAIKNHQEVLGFIKSHILDTKHRPSVTSRFGPLQLKAAHPEVYRRLQIRTKVKPRETDALLNYLCGTFRQYLVDTKNVHALVQRSEDVADFIIDKYAKQYMEAHGYKVKDQQ